MEGEALFLTRRALPVDDAVKVKMGMEDFPSTLIPLFENHHEALSSASNGPLQM